MESLAFCQNCGNELGEDDLFCEQCGVTLKKIDVGETKETPKSPVKMLILLGISIVIVVGVFAIYSSMTRSAATTLSESSPSAATRLSEEVGPKIESSPRVLTGETKLNAERKLKEMMDNCNLQCQRDLISSGLTEIGIAYLQTPSGDRIYVHYVKYPNNPQIRGGYLFEDPDGGDIGVLEEIKAQGFKVIGYEKRCTVTGSTIACT